MDNETKALLAIGGIALAATAGIVGYQVYKAKKETKRFREQATQELKDIQARHLRHVHEHGERMQKLREEDAAMQERHARVMDALNKARAEGLALHAENLKVIEDVAAGKITVEAALKKLRANQPPKKPARRLPRLNAVA